MRILKKVLILTLFYEIVAILSAIIGLFRDIAADDTLIVVRIIYAYSITLTSVIVNYAMCLMQQHNKTKYDKFLKILDRLKLYYCICCCCKSVISDEKLADEIVENTTSGTKNQHELENTASVTLRTTTSELERNDQKTE